MNFMKKKRRRSRQKEIKNKYGGLKRISTVTHRSSCVNTYESWKTKNNARRLAYWVVACNAQQNEYRYTYAAQASAGALYIHGDLAVQSTERIWTKYARMWLRCAYAHEQTHTEMVFFITFCICWISSDFYNTILRTVLFFVTFRCCCFFYFVIWVSWCARVLQTCAMCDDDDDGDFLSGFQNAHN